MTTRTLRILAGCALSAMTITAMADWSAWERMSGSGRLSMRSTDVNNDIGCAFAFRNDSNARLTGAKIHYIHSGRVDNDILPAMNPGEEIGGWTAFSVEDRCSNVRVQIYDETWD